MTITKDMLISDIFEEGNKEAMADVLFSVGMHCLGCAFANGETVEQAAAVHGIDANALVSMLQAAQSK